MPPLREDLMTERLGNVGEAMIEAMPPRQRFDTMPRPLKYVRPRLYPEQAPWLKALVQDEQAELLTDLTHARKVGKAEDDPDVVGIRRELEWAASFIKDLDLAMIEFAGTEEG